MNGLDQVKVKKEKRQSHATNAGVSNESQPPSVQPKMEKKKKIKQKNP